MNQPFALGIVAGSRQASANLASSLLLHFDGANNSTSITDSSANGFAVTAVGDAKLSTTDFKFSTACLLLDGSGDRITLPYNAALHLSSGDFTIDFWVRSTSTAASIAACGDLGTFSNGQAWWFLISAAGKAQWNGYNTGAGSASVSVTSTTSINDGNYHHIAVTRQGNTFRIFVDGALEASATYSGTLWAGLSTQANRGFAIGASAALSGHLNGRIDEFRIVSGGAQWTASFTPPTAPYSA